MSDDGRAARQPLRTRSRLPTLRRQIRDLQEHVDQLSTTIGELAADQHGGTRAVTEDDLQLILAARRARETYFGPDLFADPGWDILLSLYVAKLQGKTLSVAPLSEISGVPTSTTMRWVNILDRAGWVKRKPDPSDRRRVNVELSDRGVATLQVYFDAVRGLVTGI